MDMVCVPLYDTLGENAVEYIIGHAETRFVLAAGAKLATLAKAVVKVGLKGRWATCLSLNQ